MNRISFTFVRNQQAVASDHDAKAIAAGLSRKVTTVLSQLEILEAVEVLLSGSTAHACHERSRSSAASGGEACALQTAGKARAEPVLAGANIVSLVRGYLFGPMRELRTKRPRNRRLSECPARSQRVMPFSAIDGHGRLFYL